jgi:hypothetical protein
MAYGTGVSKNSLRFLGCAFELLDGGGGGED